MKYQIPVFAAEREAGIADLVRSNASVAYVVPIEPLGRETDFAQQLSRTFASQHEGESTFDLYFLKDILVTTGWNANRDVFDKYDTWAARHTSDHKPFNFEHKPLDIIGHILTSSVVDDSYSLIDDTLDVDSLPDKFHILNGTVIYRNMPDDERAALIEQTIAEIEAGDWFVSMEAYFRGFDYALRSLSDGRHAVIPRSAESAFLTKHLRQYGGSGTYVDATTKNEYELGRVLRNITFSGKGLVRKPANPESIILKSVAEFVPETKDLGYITSGTDATSSMKEESIQMPETVDVNIETLQSEIASLKTKNEELTAELNIMKNKDTEETIASLRSDVEASGQRVTELTAQLDAAKEASVALQARAEAAETALAAAQQEVAAMKAAETKRARLAVLADNGLSDTAAAEKLVDKFAVLSDEDFSETVATLAPSWKTVVTPKVNEAQVIEEAKVDPDPVLATAGNNDEAERAQAKVNAYKSYFTSILRPATKVEQTASK